MSSVENSEATRTPEPVETRPQDIPQSRSEGKNLPMPIPSGGALCADPILGALESIAEQVPNRLGGIAISRIVFAAFAALSATNQDLQKRYDRLREDHAVLREKMAKVTQQMRSQSVLQWVSSGLLTVGGVVLSFGASLLDKHCLLYTSPSPRD